MWQHVIALLGLALLCGAWAAVQRWIAQREPATRGPESGCALCSCKRGNACDRAAVTVAPDRPEARVGAARAAPGDRV